MNRFAFYGRVSTEDQQDPASSRQWQRARSSALIEPTGGEIVAEYFDIGQSRSLPWKRRPESARLLADLRRADRGFDAVVIGEPARAFYGQQFGLIFPVFIHYGVQLWVPEVGGAVDPGSDAHDLVMSLYGGMSKGERNRIKVRVRSAMASKAATEGRFLGGRPPYGYQLGDAGPHPNPAKAAIGQRSHRLEIDSVAAPVVQRIFTRYISGAGFRAIAEDLTAEGIPSPSAPDPARNRHRSAAGGAWGKSAVRAIIENPRYTGRQVWNRQRREEVLVDVEDVAAGHETKLRWNDPTEWIWSAGVVHEPIIDPDTFGRAQDVRAAGAHRPNTTKRPRTKRTYPLSGLVRCGLCGRRMQGSHNHGHNNYRCTFAAEYAIAKGVDHPKAVYLREDTLTGALDEWIGGVFDEDHAETTWQAIADARDPDDPTVARREAAERRIADCDALLANYRKALDAGADALTIAGWIREVKGERLTAEQELGGIVAPADELTIDQIRALIRGVQDAVAVLATADPKLKAQVYNELGIEVTYQPEQRQAVVTARVGQCVSEGGLELGLQPCRSVPSNAGLPSAGAGFDDSTFWSVPSRTVPYQPVFRTFADKLMTSTGVCRTQGAFDMSFEFAVPLRQQRLVITCHHRLVTAMTSTTSVA